MCIAVFELSMVTGEEGTIDCFFGLKMGVLG